MRIYKIWQTKNGDYDTYDSAVVVAMSKEQAIKIHPNGTYDYLEEDEDSCFCSTWVEKEFVQVEYIGETNIKKHGVIVASFNAG